MFIEQPNDIQSSWLLSTGEWKSIYIALHQAREEKNVKYFHTKKFFLLHPLSLGSERFLWEIYVDTFVGFGWRCSSVDQWSINVLLLAVHRFIFFRLTHRCDGKLCVCIYLNILFFGPESNYLRICVTKESIVLDSQSIDVCVAMIRFDWLIWLMAIFIIRWNTLTK